MKKYLRNMINFPVTEIMFTNVIFISSFIKFYFNELLLISSMQHTPLLQQY
jgi:hypothetical protein